MTKFWPVHKRVHLLSPLSLAPLPAISTPIISMPLTSPTTSFLPDLAHERASSPLFKASAFAFRSFPLLICLPSAFAPLGNKRHHHHHFTLRFVLPGSWVGHPSATAAERRGWVKQSPSGPKVYPNHHRLEASEVMGLNPPASSKSPSRPHPLFYHHHTPHHLDVPDCVAKIARSLVRLSPVVKPRIEIRGLEYSVLCMTKYPSDSATDQR